MILPFKALFYTTVALDSTKKKNVVWPYEKSGTRLRPDSSWADDVTPSLNRNKEGEGGEEEKKTKKTGRAAARPGLLPGF